jgi:periplasmic divalent cation tolerance protein
VNRRRGVSPRRFLLRANCGYATQIARHRAKCYNMFPMSEYVQITTTTGARHDAERIAAELVSRRLAACVQVSGPIVSTYRWNDAVETAEEWLCTAKTSWAMFAEIERVVKQLHPYEVPELIATPIVAGNEAYLKWLGEQLGGEESSRTEER